MLLADLLEDAGEIPFDRKGFLLLQQKFIDDGWNVKTERKSGFRSGPYALRDIMLVATKLGVNKATNNVVHTIYVSFPEKLTGIGSPVKFRITSKTLQGSVHAQGSDPEAVWATFKKGYIVNDRSSE